MAQPGGQPAAAVVSHSRRHVSAGRRRRPRVRNCRSPASGYAIRKDVPPDGGERALTLQLPLGGHRDYEAFKSMASWVASILIDADPVRLAVVDGAVASSGKHRKWIQPLAIGEVPPTTRRGLRPPPEFDPSQQFSQQATSRAAGIKRPTRSQDKIRVINKAFNLSMRENPAFRDTILW